MEDEMKLTYFQIEEIKTLNSLKNITLKKSIKTKNFSFSFNKGIYLINKLDHDI